MEKNMVNLSIDDEMVRPIIEKQIQAAIVWQLGSQEDLIEKMVGLALKQKVSSDGTIGRYSSDNKYDFLEVVTKNAIQEAARGALKQWLATNMHKVTDAVLKELKKPNRQRTIATAFADAVEKSLKCNWHMTCQVNFKETRD